MCTLLQDLVIVGRALSRNTAPVTTYKYIISWENQSANTKSLVLIFPPMIGKAKSRRKNEVLLLIDPQK